MPLFYFDSHGGGVDAVSDSDGLSFDTIEAAQIHAMSLLPLMNVGPPLGAGEYRTWTVTIRDDDGEIKSRFVLAPINDRVGPLPVRHLRSVT